ncbi:MAG: hypothetical protein ACYTBZ_09115 [Planctomycetota bacterium]
MPPSTPIQIDGRPFFPIGLYSYPKHDPKVDVYESMAKAGFNFYMLPLSATKEQLDAAQANGIKIILRLGHLMNLSGTPKELAKKKKALTERIVPESLAYKHPAVVALEGPDEPLWGIKIRQQKRYQVLLGHATWARSPEQIKEIADFLNGLRDGYAEIRRLCGKRYQVWLNFAPRSDEDELRWFTELPVVGPYAQDGRTTADVFGTDIYPTPRGGGNNGWIRGRLVGSAAAVGAFTEKLGRAVNPHPFYMVLQGCGISEWDAKLVEAGKNQRRPTFSELQFMVFDALVHGASGILYWGANYIDDQSLYWRHISRVNRQLRALAPVLAEGENWPEARPGRQEMNVLGKIYKSEHYVLTTCNQGGYTIEAKIAVPGWKCDRVYSLLDGRVVPAVNGVIHDQMLPLSVRVYTDGTSLFEALGLPAESVLSRQPMRTLFGLPTNMEPFKGKSPEVIVDIVKRAGVDGVVKMPHDPELVKALHREGIKAYAEISCFAGRGAWKKFPGTQPITNQGEPFDPEGGYGGLCLNNDAYLSDLLERIDHLLGEADWDGLWLDFIRWPGRWEEKEPKLIPVCFCDTCLPRFAADRGVRYPGHLTTTKQIAAWILAEHAGAFSDWKCDRVADVVARIRRLMTEKLGSNAILGIFGVPMRQADFDGVLHRIYGQDWAKLGPYIDVFSPMVYHIYCHRPLEWISQVVAEVSQQSGRTVWPIVQSCSTPSPMTVEEFEKALYEGLKSPSSGIMVYSTRHTIQENKWETMSRVYNQVSAGP